MINKDELCEKIREIYPDIGQCDTDINVAFDDHQDRWAVDLKKDRQQLKTYLEDNDAEACLLGGQCIGLGIEVAQLRDSMERMP